MIKTNVSRRSFLKASALAGGGMVLSFSWLAGCKPTTKEELLQMPDEWFELNNYIKIGENGVVTLVSANPEFGSNVKTSMPMILADELDVPWKHVVVEQADFYPERFDRQFTGGSQGIRQGWKPLRAAGATARAMLISAAAQSWKVPESEITTSEGFVIHEASGKKANYGEFASLAATLQVPEEVSLKEVKDFSIIGKSQKNVDGKKIVTGKPLFTIDHKVDGMVVATVIHPPAFGMKVSSFDGEEAKKMAGVVDVFTVKTLKDDYERNGFDTTTFTELVVVAANSTWEALNAKKAVKVTWEEAGERQFVVQGWGGKQTVTIPGELESTAGHRGKMAEFSKKPGKIVRKDGDPESAFKSAAKVIERSYSAPFLAHNCMEPVNCFADVKADKAVFYAPIQAPEFIQGTIAARLGIPKENIQINLARMGGGFGQRAYGHHLVEAGAISQHLQKPVKMVYTREDDMSYGIYRPSYSATYRAALDEENNLLAFHVKAGGIPETPLHANRFPAGAIDNYLAESWEIPSNITIGAFRAPRSNFMASAEQSFLDELAEAMGKDPIALRLELLERAKTNPVGKDNDYDPDRYAGVIKLVQEKSNWNMGGDNPNKGVAAYFCHNTYVAEVLEMEMKDNQPMIQKVTAAVDCGIVVNPDAAANMGEGGIVDGIGNALYGEQSFANGVPQKLNFDTYKIIRHRDAPKSIDIHFVQNQEDPTGLGEPLFPPTFAAVANAMYKASGKRFYNQLFMQEDISPKA